MRLILVSLLFVFSPYLYGQNNDSENKLGIKTSINASTIFGSELINPRFKYGYTAGAYYQYSINKKWAFQTEFLGNFKGSKFKNGIGKYSKIATFYLDLPLLAVRHLDNNKTQSLLIGPSISYLALSSLFIGQQKKAELNVLDLKDMDFGVAIYYQKNSKIASFQIGAKIGLTNVNNGINFVDIKPATGNNGTIKNLGLEIGFLF